jgi:hypothetical protein
VDKPRIPAEVWLWDLATQQVVQRLRGHTGWVFDVSFSRDSTRLASAGGEPFPFPRPGHVKVWAVEGGQELLTLSGRASPFCKVAFSSDGRHLAAAEQAGSVHLWDATLSVEMEHGRQAEAHVDALLADVLPQAEVIDRLRSDSTLLEPLRMLALPIAKARDELPWPFLNNASWATVRRPGLGTESYRLALRQAEGASHLAPMRAEVLNTLGVAQYRAGKYREALSTLRRSDALRGGIPANHAFIAMAEQELGQVQEARASLQRLRALMKNPARARDAEGLGFLREAEARLEQER